jgi:dTDP-glucose pyrophosphorylase/predicted transcriptional regulator
MYRTEQELHDLIIQATDNLKDAIRIIDNAHVGIGIIVDGNRKVLGILTDPDIRRLILKSANLNQKICNVMNTNPTLVYAKDANKEGLTRIFIEKGFLQIPIVNNEKVFIDLVLKSDVFKPDLISEVYSEKIESSVVIMAGGRGTRMEPFTTILPKPLMPIGNKSMLEIIMEEYAKYGMKDFCISVNYKANLIKAYLADINTIYNISYIQEEKPLGTAGSLKLLDEQTYKTPFFVSNCDIIIKADYAKIYNFHRSHGYDITIVASFQSYKVPYGVCEIEEEGVLSRINEKPEYNFLVNTGMYVINPGVLQYIPHNEFFHITDLIEKLKSLDRKVGVYPVTEKSWVDIGQWSEYKEALKLLSII